MPISDAEPAQPAQHEPPTRAASRQPRARRPRSASLYAPHDSACPVVPLLSVLQALDSVQQSMRHSSSAALRAVWLWHTQPALHHLPRQGLC